MSILALVRSRLHSAWAIGETIDVIEGFYAFLNWLSTDGDEGFDLRTAAEHHERILREAQEPPDAFEVDQ